MPSGWAWQGDRRAGCWIGRRPTCGSGASTARPGQSLNAQWRSPRRPLGLPDPEVARRCDELGRVLRALGDLARAQVQFERALAIGEAALGADDPDVASWRNSLGSVLHDLGDLAGARVQFERALAISEVVLGADHVEVAIWRSNLGGVLRDLGSWPARGRRWSGRWRSVRGCLAPTTRTWAPRAAAWALSCRTLGIWPARGCSLSGRWRSARGCLAPTTPDAATWRNNLGLVLQDLGDLTGTRVQLERAVSDRGGGARPRPPARGHLPRQPGCGSRGAWR